MEYAEYGRNAAHTDPGSAARDCNMFQAWRSSSGSIQRKMKIYRRHQQTRRSSFINRELFHGLKLWGL